MSFIVTVDGEQKVFLPCNEIKKITIQQEHTKLSKTEAEFEHYDIDIKTK